MKRLGPTSVPLIGLVALLLMNAALSPGFLAVTVRDGHLSGSIVDVFLRAVPVLLLSIGMTLVIATGGVDLSVGAVMAIAGAVAAGILVHPAGTPFANISGTPTMLAVLGIPIAVAATAGAFNGLLVAAGIQPIVATLALMVAGRGVAQLLTNGQIVTFTDERMSALGNGFWLGLPIPIWIAAACALAVFVLVRKSALGLFISATGASERASYLVGIPNKGIKVFAYLVCGLLAGVAGLIACSDIKGADSHNAGLYLELDAILATCLGGTSMTGGRFNLAGTIVGAILMQTLTTIILTRGVSLEATLITKAVLVIGVCLFQSPVFRAKLTREKSA
ncbi:MAG: ABC transporter permease [Fimbriimonadaceae bacterium]